MMEGPGSREGEVVTNYPRVFIVNRARAAIVASGRSQRAVAEQAGLEPSQLTKILNYEGEVDPNRKGGGPTLRALALIAWALKRPFGDLFQLSVEEPKQTRRAS